jgi:hypothetical protein
MTRTRTHYLPVILLAVVATGVAIAAPPELPGTPLAAADLLYAREFSLAEGFAYLFSAEKPLVTSGWILILEVDPAIAYPRQQALPVLYVGDRTASYVARGYPSGRILAMVPGDVDLFNAPVWFGTPELPERVDGAVILKEAAMAREKGMGPFPEQIILRALEAGGEPLVLQNIAGLEEAASGLAQKYITSR